MKRDHIELSKHIKEGLESLKLRAETSVEDLRNDHELKMSVASSDIERLKSSMQTVST